VSRRIVVYETNDNGHNDGNLQAMA